MFKKRVAKFDYSKKGSSEKWTGGLSGCPDVWELESGDYAVIGIRSTSTLKAQLPEDAGCGPDEEIVIVPREVFDSCK